MMTSPPQRHDVSKRYVPQPHPTTFHPRWVMLAALALMSVVLVGIWVRGYYSGHACGLGSLQFLCGLDLLPGIIQVLGILALAEVALGLVRGIGRAYDPDRLAAEATGPRAMLWRLTEYPRVRTLAWILAAIIAVGLVIDALGARLDVATVMVSVIALYATLRCATYRPPRLRARLTLDTSPTRPPHRRKARVLGWMLPSSGTQTAPLASGHALSQDAEYPTSSLYADAPRGVGRQNPYQQRVGPFTPFASAVVNSPPVTWMLRAVDSMVTFITSRFLDPSA